MSINGRNGSPPLSSDRLAVATEPVRSTSPDRPVRPQWLSLPAVPESVRQARRFAVDTLSEVVEGDPGHVDDVVLVVSELITNAVREVAGVDPDASVRLGIAALPRWTHLYAVDGAPALPRQAPHEPLAGSGRGIPIINSLAAMTWLEQGEHDKTIHVVLARAGITLTPRERHGLLPEPRRHDALLRPREVATMFGVRPSTIARWAREGRLTALLTPGGHRRYRLGHVRALFPDTEAGLDPSAVDDAVRLYEQGWTIRQVAARFEYGYGAMRRVLKDHTTLRTRGGTG
jgi:hypothetical protein